MVGLIQFDLIFFFPRKHQFSLGHEPPPIAVNEVVSFPNKGIQCHQHDVTEALCRAEPCWAAPALLRVMAVGSAGLVQDSSEPGPLSADLNRSCPYLASTVAQAQGKHSIGCLCPHPVNTG